MITFVFGIRAPTYRSLSISVAIAMKRLQQLDEVFEIEFEMGKHKNHRISVEFNENRSDKIPALIMYDHRPI